MTVLLLTQADLDKAIGQLGTLEPRFAPLVRNNSAPRLRTTEPGFASLLRLITHQMISLKAARSIWVRLEQLLPTISPQSLARLDESELGSVGLSGPKIRTMQGLARACLADPQVLEKLGFASDGEVRRTLTALPGIGPWTAELYLLQALARADAWPGGDVALQQAAMSVFDLPARPDARTMERLAENWRPWRSAAACLLWEHYRTLRGNMMP